MDTSELSSPTLKALATGLRRHSSRLRTSARRTGENGSSSWPTATAEDAESSQARRPNDTTLTEAVKDWPTPNAADSERTSETHQGGNLTLEGAALWQTPKAPTGGNVSRGHDRKGEPLLAGQAQMWSTPRAISGGVETAERKQELGREESGGGDLQAMALNWPTPQANDAPNTNANQKNMPPSLGAASRSFPLPQATPPDGAASSSDGPSWLPPLTLRWMFEQFSRQHSEGLSGLLRQVATEGSAGVRRMRLPRDLWDESRSLASSRRKRLNPMFVEWLMGWPIRMTSLAPLDSGSPATAWCRYRQRMASAFSALGSTVTVEEFPDAAH